MQNLYHGQRSIRFRSFSVVSRARLRDPLETCITHIEQAEQRIDERRSVNTGAVNIAVVRMYLYAGEKIGYTIIKIL